MRRLAIAFLTTALSAIAQPEAGAESAPAPPPSDAECKALPPISTPLSFATGELLEYELDAMGIAQAGRLTMHVLPVRDGKLPVEVKAQTNTLFSKVRRVKGLATSYMDPQTLHPVRYIEDGTENEVRKHATVSFSSKDHAVQLEYKMGNQAGQNQFRYANDGLDAVATVYLLRQLPLKQGTALCLDVYGLRRLWRLSGKVEGREHVSLPIGEFEAWHLSGTAVRLDDPRHRREVHLWISDDQRRLPLAVVGAIDLGAVRARLTAFSRPGEKTVRAQGKESLKW
jgi:hypothetical protein